MWISSTPPTMLESILTSQVCSCSNKNTASLPFGTIFYVWVTSLYVGDFANRSLDDFEDTLRVVLLESFSFSLYNAIII